MSYRFNTSSDLDGHAVGNLILTSMMDITGSIKNSIEALSKLLDVKQKVLPISEDYDLTLVAKMENGKVVEGEAEITKSESKIKKIYYLCPWHQKPYYASKVSKYLFYLFSVSLYALRTRLSN